jgi:hypothetical protein
MKQHLLKTDPDAFDAVAQGIKTYEIRFNDRDYQVEDELILLKTLQTGEAMKLNNLEPFYTGDIVRARVIHILSGPIYGLAEGWVIMSILKLVG